MRKHKTPQNIKTYSEERNEVSPVAFVAHSARGVVPDFYSENGLHALLEGNTTTLEFSDPHGNQTTHGIIPWSENEIAPAGNKLRQFDKGRKSKEGSSGGAGSFSTAPAYTGMNNKRI